MHKKRHDVHKSTAVVCCYVILNLSLILSAQEQKSIRKKKTEQNKMLSAKKHERDKREEGNTQGRGQVRDDRNSGEQPDVKGSKASR